MTKTKEQAAQDLKELVVTIVELLKNNNVGIGVTKDKKFVLIDSDTGVCMELEE
ncbi:hypothetical protein [Paramaledivibacter caminithermalis]|uniref:Uncharacterized protein n=1 Tax=Paramaledivibacter caminithermalis (strain DSM 15212 / CIP 107654 / DViRD3) TaxID=1121301 RepID=A0A1M6MSN0_PARC5|nr:hypothetical protein [Paramaledivibacter caminithermalis]SHJ86410.1 hypothetical protein SAMN02745912_01396 [Paramaledivibacter caminithermalis DSM 15212]